MSGPILIFDSGVGGLSVVKALRDATPLKVAPTPPLSSHLI